MVSAVGDLHVSTVTRDSFDLWRIGWLTFVQVPLAPVELSMVLVRGDVRMYGGVRINVKMRAILIDWLVEVRLIDQYIVRRPVSRRQLQLVSLATMLIAAKF